jgi:hypothetical protein
MLFHRTAVFPASAMLAALIFAPGCEKDKKESGPEQRSAALEPSTRAANAAPAGETPTVHAHMAEHYAQALAMKQAAIGGDLNAYAKAAAWLAEHELSSSAPEVWRTHAAAMQEAAREARDAADLEAAAVALGRVGLACARCHDELGAPELAVGEPPAAGSGSLPHMLRHQWAADRLWDGLMAPSDASWTKGAEAMADAPLTAAELAPDQSAPHAVTTLAGVVHERASEARTQTGAGRARAYGALIAACSDCHAQLRRDPTQRDPTQKE